MYILNVNHLNNFNAVTFDFLIVYIQTVSDSTVLSIPTKAQNASSFQNHLGQYVIHNFHQFLACSSHMFAQNRRYSFVRYWTGIYVIRVRRRETNMDQATSHQWPFRSGCQKKSWLLDEVNGSSQRF